MKGRCCHCYNGVFFVKTEGEMNYAEAVKYMARIQTGPRIKPGLTTTKTLMQYLGDPQDRLSFIHVAGTNGKGSTSAMISSIYAGRGLKVGRYVSPTVFSEREKIQYRLDDQTVYISEKEMAQCVSRIREAVERMRGHGHEIPTEFEMETAAAFLMFDRWNCDVVVLETGMGGRLDATNIIKTTICAVITPIAMDHMNFLGHSIEEIAGQKAGIIKGHVPVVTSQHDRAAERCIETECRKQSSEFRRVTMETMRVVERSPGRTRFDYGKYDGLEIRLSGLFQIENACLAIECIEMLQQLIPVSPEQLREGLRRAVWRGRFEIIHTNPTVVVDGAHNVDGMEHFLSSVNAYFKSYRKIGIMGVFADKDYVNMVQRIGHTFCKIYTVTPPSERGLPAEELAACFCGDARPCVSMREAFARAGEDCGGDEETVLFIFGSLSLLKSVYDLYPALKTGCTERRT